MSTPPNSTATASPALARWGRLVARLLLLLLLSLLAARLLNFASATMKNRIEPAGFWSGALHGACMPCTWPALALGQEVELYAHNNTGRPYKLGYTLGVNACGALFFGLLYRRLSRWRQSRPPQ